MMEQENIFVAAASILLTWLGTKGVKIIKTWKGAKLAELQQREEAERLREASEFEERKYMDSQIAEAHKFLIDQLTKRVDGLESKQDIMRTEHIQCVEKTGMMQGRLEEQKHLIEHLTDEVVRIRRHEEANKAWVDVLKTQVKEVQSGSISTPTEIDANVKIATDPMEHKHD